MASFGSCCSHHVPSSSSSSHSLWGTNCLGDQENTGQYSCNCSSAPAPNPGMLGLSRFQNVANSLGKLEKIGRGKVWRGILKKPQGQVCMVAMVTRPWRSSHLLLTRQSFVKHPDAQVCSNPIQPKSRETSDVTASLSQCHSLGRGHQGCERNTWKKPPYNTC